MFDYIYIRGIGVVFITWGLLLFFTSDIFYNQAMGAVILTAGVPMAIEYRHPTIHRYTGMIFSTAAALFFASTKFGSACGAIGGAFLTIGAMLLIDSSTIMRNGVGAVLITWGVLLRMDPGPVLGLDPLSGACVINRFHSDICRSNALSRNKRT